MQSDAYHCTADQGLGALGLEFLIETNTECRWYHTLIRKKKDQLRIETLFIIETLITYLKSANRILLIPLLIFVKKRF